MTSDSQVIYFMKKS